MKFFISASLIIHVCLALLFSALAITKSDINEAQFIDVADIHIPSLSPKEHKLTPGKTEPTEANSRAKINTQSMQSVSSNATAVPMQQTKENLPARIAEAGHTINDKQQQAIAASEKFNQPSVSHTDLPQMMPTAQPSGDIQFGSTAGPSFAHQVQPVYPFMARKLAIEGKVLLRLTIDSTGKLQDIKIIENPGYGFTASAIDALNKSKFLPAYHNGKPVRTNALLPIRFAMRK